VLLRVTMENFWEGFVKRAGEDPLAFWARESKDEEKKAKAGKKVLRVSPVELSQGFAPDTWPRYWP